MLRVAVGSLLGVAVHCGVFNRGEWHVQAPAIFLGHFWVAFSLVVGQYTLGPDAARLISSTLLPLNLGYLLGLFVSIIIYRVALHPLTRPDIPGPVLARVTKLWHVYQARNSTNHLVLAGLHEKYGDFVRTGPSEVTVFHPDVFLTIDGPRSTCIKSEWYDILHPNLALVTARNKAIHSARRRQWNQGFTTKALDLHEKKVMKYIDQLEKCIDQDATGNDVSNIRDYLFWFGFDAMGDFVFNKSFGMLENHQWHHLIVRLQRALSLLGPLSPTPWLVQLGFNLAPRVSVLKDWFQMVAWCEKQMWERIKSAESKDLTLDLAHYLMEESGTNHVSDDNWFWMKGDSLLAIVAGSEPTAAALVGVFSELAKHPRYIDLIFEEVKQVVDGDLKALAELPYLNGVLNEALRLYPALLTGGARKTTQEIMIGGISIPAHTTIIAPRYSISRREDCFVNASQFIPERWSAQPELVINKTGFTPFGTGHHSCLGRPLATDIMRMVVARLVKKFSFELAPGETGRRVAEELKDQFTSNPGPLSLKFSIRSTSPLQRVKQDVR